MNGLVTLKKNARILIEVHHGFGDVIQTIPLIANIRKYLPHAYIAVIVRSEEHAKLVAATGLVDKCFMLWLRKMSFGKIIKLIIALRKQAFDVGFIFPGTDKQAGFFLFKIINCKYFIFESEHDTQCFSRAIGLANKENLHFVERTLNLLTATNIPIDVCDPYIEAKGLPLPVWVDCSSFAGHKVVGISVGCGVCVKKRFRIKNVYSFAKRWPIEKFNHLISELLQKGIKVILFGGADEVALYKQGLRQYDNNCNVMNVIGKIDILESAALVQKCDLFISADTGMLLLADAVGIRTLGLYGPTNPAICRAHSDRTNIISLRMDCQYCYEENIDMLFRCEHFNCMKKISSNVVLAKALETLE